MSKPQSDQKTCTEIAIFTVTPETKVEVLQLSEQIFSEMNAETVVILEYKLIEKTDNPNELCWLLTWRDAESAKSTTKNWPNYPSTPAFQALVGNNVYYGQFVTV
jgi:quinol monooxygenase YgiN